MDTFIIRTTGLDRQNAAFLGNRFLCANGYMGMRGMPEDAGRELFPAITLAGVYDRHGDRWREPVNAFNALHVTLRFDGRPLDPLKARAFESSLDLSLGLYGRSTDYGPVRVTAKRFLSMAQPHLMADRLTVEALETGELTVTAGISGDIWDINGPHLFDAKYETGEPLTAAAVTGEKGITVAAAQAFKCEPAVRCGYLSDGGGCYRALSLRVKKGDRLTVTLWAAIYTAPDTPDPLGEAAALAKAAAQMGFDRCLQEHRAAWDLIRAGCFMTVSGNDRAALALNASLYHLNAIAPRHRNGLSIPARGLSGQTYKGAIFWDSEIFFFPMFVHTQPEIALSLLRYRIDTLDGARRKAGEYGYSGAFYAWESQEGGEEGCTNFNVVDVFTHRPVRTYFRDKQIHISADIVYALMRYYEITGDRTLLRDGGAEVVLECARFYLSRANCRLDRTEIDFADVIGPDEYHERVTNNAFTNRMIRHCLDSALRLRDIFSDDPAWLDGLIRSLDYEKDWAMLRPARDHLRAPRLKNGVIEQFDGYFDLEDVDIATVRARLRDPREYWGGDHGVAGTTQIIKQADVIAMMALFPHDHTDVEVERSFDFYEPRTEHGSSLSACMYALTACRLGKLEKAYELFLKTAEIDLVGGGKEWAGDIYIGGTHPASNGGAWMIAALGFAGLTVQNGEARLSPRLPAEIKSLSFPFCAGKKRLRATVTHEGAWMTEEPLLH